MPANQELAALLARRRSKISDGKGKNEPETELDDPIPMAKEPAPNMDTDNDDSSRKDPLNIQNSHVNRKPFGGGPPKLPFGLSSGKSLASRRPPSSTRNALNTDKGEIGTETSVRSNLPTNYRSRPHSVTSGLVDEEKIQNDVDNQSKGMMSPIQRQNSWSRLASGNTMSRSSPRTIITEDKKDSLHGRPSWSQITDDSSNQVSPDRSKSLQTVASEEKYEISSNASIRKTERSWIRPREDDNSNQVNDTASRAGSDVPSSVAEFQEEFSRDALKQWKNKGKWNKSSSTSRGQMLQKEAEQDIEQNSTRKKFAPWQKPGTSTVQQESQNNEDTTPQKKFNTWRKPQPQDTTIQSTGNDDSKARNKFSTWKRPQQDNKTPEVNAKEESTPTNKFASWNKRNNVDVNQNDETVTKNSGHASWKVSQPNNEPVAEEQNDNTVPAKNKFATWRRPQPDNKPTEVPKSEEANPNKSVPVWKRPQPITRSEEAKTEVPKNEEPNSNKSVPAWKRPQPITRSEETEVPAHSQNETTTPKDKFAYWKTTKQEKEHEEVKEEENAKNKFAYWKKPQSEKESAGIGKDDNDFAKNKFAYWKQPQSTIKPSNVAKEEHVTVKDKFAYWKKSQPAKELTSESEEDHVTPSDDISSTKLSEPSEETKVGDNETDSLNNEELYDDEVTHNEIYNVEKETIWNETQPTDPSVHSSGPQMSIPSIVTNNSNSWKNSSYDESPETSEFEPYSPKNKTKFWVKSHSSNQEDKESDQTTASNNKFAAWKKSQPLNTSNTSSDFEFTSAKESFPNETEPQLSVASDEISIEDVNSTSRKQDQLSGDFEMHADENQSDTWSDPSTILQVDEEPMDLNQKTRDKQPTSISDNLFDEQSSPINSFAAARMNLVSSLKLNHENNEQVDSTKTEKIEFPIDMGNDNLASMSNELFEESFSPQSNQSSNIVNNSPDMFADHFPVHPKRFNVHERSSRSITQSPSESSLEEHDHTTTFKSAFNNDSDSLYVKKKPKSKIKTKKSLDFSPLVPEEALFATDEAQKTIRSGLDNKSSRGFATSSASVGSKSGYEKRVGRFLARKSKMKHSQNIQGTKKGPLTEKNDVDDIDSAHNLRLENKKLQEWSTSPIDFSQTIQGSSSVCSVHSASSRRRRSEIRRQKSRSKDQPSIKKFNEKEVTEVEKKAMEEFDFFKNAPDDIDNMNDILETSKCDDGDMDSITGEIRSSYEADAKSSDESKTDSLQKTSETQHLHIGATSLFSAAIINKPVKESVARTTLGISSRPETPLDPFIDDSEIPHAPTDLSNSQYSVMPFDEAKDNRTFRPVASERPKPAASDTMYLTPKFTRKKSSISEEPVSIITPEDQRSIENIIGNNSSFSIVEKGSGGSVVVELQTENSKLRQKIDFLQDNLSQKDVMIEHLTKIVEGFQAKTSSQSSNDFLPKNTTKSVQPTIKESVEVRLSESFNSTPGNPPNVDSPLRYPDTMKKTENDEYAPSETFMSTTSKTSSYRHARERRERRRTKVKGPIEPPMHLADKKVNSSSPLAHTVNSPKTDSIAIKPTTKSAVMNVGRKAIRASNAQRRFLC